MTTKEALEQLRELIKKHKIELSWDSAPVSFEELIIARDGPEVFKKIDEALK